MTERPANTISMLRTLDFRVAQMLRKANSSPFLGLLEFFDEDRARALDAILIIGNDLEVQSEF